MTSSPAEQAVSAVIEAFHAGFAAGDADRCADLFTADGRLYLLYRDALEDRESIRVYFRESFERLDTSAWEPRTELLDVHADGAAAFITYTERLRDRRDGSRQLVRGRLVLLLAGPSDGEGWRIRLLMNSHSHRMEPIE